MFWILVGRKTGYCGQRVVCPSFKRLNFEPTDFQHHTKRLQQSTCLAPQLCRGETKQKIKGNGKQSWADPCQTKTLCLGKDSADLLCSLALSINTWNGLRASPCPHVPRLFPSVAYYLGVSGCDFKCRVSAHWNTWCDVKLNSPWSCLWKTCISVCTKVTQHFTFYALCRLASPVLCTFATAASRQHAGVWLEAAVDAV